jgi:hypothetical protein
MLISSWPLIWSSIFRIAVGALLLALAGGRLSAAELDAEPTGTWKWTFQTQDGEMVSTTLIIHRTGDKLIGTLTGRNGAQLPIQEARMVGNVLSFTIARARDAQQLTLRYEGKIEGDKITGKVRVERGGNSRSRNWTAEREPSDINGVWQVACQYNNAPVAFHLRLKQEGEKLSGTATFQTGKEAAISDAAIHGNSFEFQLVSPRDPGAPAWKFTGKIAGDSLQGKMSADANATELNFDWRAARERER